MSYSLDLRERVVHAVREQGFTLQGAAHIFQIGTSTVQRYLRRHQAGELAPRTSPGRPGRLTHERATLLQAHLLEHNDLTLRKRCDAWAVLTGMHVSTATMSRWIRRVNSTRKKDELRE